MEGYSDFLQVLASPRPSSGSVRLLRAGQDSHVFTINKAWSLACGVGVVWLTFRMLRRAARYPRSRAGSRNDRSWCSPGRWPSGAARRSRPRRCSFLISGARRVGDRSAMRTRRSGWIATAGVRNGGLAGARIDGFVYVGTVIGSRNAACAAPGGGAISSQRVVLPVTGRVHACINCGESGTFGDLLPAPSMTKVLGQAAAGHVPARERAGRELRGAPSSGCMEPCPSRHSCAVSDLSRSRSRVVVGVRRSPPPS